MTHLSSLAGAPVIRRRPGVAAVAPKANDLLFQTLASSGLSVEQRLGNVLTHMREARQSNGTDRSKITLRDDQHDVFDDTERYIGNCTAHLALYPGKSYPWGRFIQPPRTGKAILIAEIIARSGAHSLVVVPYVNLVDQMASELRQKLNGIPVGVYHSGEKNLVTRGVNVVTYDILVARHKKGKLPQAITDATIIFCDEAHRAMTELRQLTLKEAFAPDALRIACTATPDYNDKRVLAKYFPRLIHEIPLEEAERLGLFAKMKVKILSAKVDSSSVRVMGEGKHRRFEPETLGAVMAAAPFLDATRQILYELEETRGMSGIVFCSSVKRQAEPLLEYLVRRCPKGTPLPVLVTSTTPLPERKRILKDFESGKILTLINVNILTLGWDSPRCKLMIDLAPGLSMVQAKQKYFRVMTKYGDAVAKIFILLPAHLPAIPIFPQTLFGRSIGGMEDFETWMDEHRKTHKPQSASTPKDKAKAKRLREAKVELAVLHTFDSRSVRLNPKSRHQIGEVLRSEVTISQGYLPRYLNFRRLHFRHPLFEGFGESLLTYCGVRRQHSSCLNFLMWALPEAGASIMLKEESFGHHYCATDAQHLIDTVAQGKHGGHISDGWPAIFGPDEEDMGPLDEEICQRELIGKMMTAYNAILSERHMYVLSRRYGLEDGVDRSLDEVGSELQLSRERIRQIEREALQMLHKHLASTLVFETDDTNEEGDPKNVLSEKLTTPDAWFKDLGIWGEITDENMTNRSSVLIFGRDSVETCELYFKGATRKFHKMPLITKESTRNPGSNYERNIMEIKGVNYHGGPEEFSFSQVVWNPLT